jgi:hypothetical protein
MSLENGLYLFFCFWNKVSSISYFIHFFIHIRVIRKVVPYWAGPLIWCFIPSWLLSAKSWNFMKEGYEILRPRIKCTKHENIYSYSTHRSTVHIGAAVIGWRRSGKERTVQTQFSTKIASKLSFMPRWSSVCFFSLILKSQPLCDQTGGFGPVFSCLYG